MKQRDKKIALAAAVIAVLVLLVTISGAGRKNTGTLNQDSQKEISEAGGTNSESRETANSQSAETEMHDSGRDGSASGNGSGNGTGAPPSESHKTTNADETTETVLPAEPLTPTKVEKPDKKPAGSQAESQLGTHGGNRSDVQGESDPGTQGGNPSVTTDGNSPSQTGATTPTGSNGDGSGNPSEEESGSSEGVELPIILFD